jgi:type VI secretion system ImpM family protein
MRTVGDGEYALYGKLALARDFVRYSSKPWGIGFHAFLANGHESAQGRLIPEPVYFVARLADDGPLQCGVWIPSQDGVGRRFPLAASISLQADVGTEEAAVLPVALQEFFDQVTSALGEGAYGDLQSLQQRIANLPAPAASLLASAEARSAQALAQERVADFAARVFGEDRTDQLFYALRVIQLAAVEARDRKSVPVLLDCPITEDVDIVFWGELAQRAAGGRGRQIGLFWTESTPRLIVTPRVATPDVFAALTAASGSSAALWPLTTERPDANGRAHDELSAEMRAASEQHRPLRGLMAASFE